MTKQRLAIGQTGRSTGMIRNAVTRRAFARRIPNAAMRISYFRGLLRASKPAFCHYATALLMASDFIDKSCLTTNFDHQLERAFAEHNMIDYQSIRSDAETQFWDQSDRRCFVVKLHGDIDTNNILNTTEETLEISKNLRPRSPRCSSQQRPSCARICRKRKEHLEDVRES